MMLLVLLADVDEEKGVPINVLAKLMKVDPSFVTMQSKLLERKRLLRHHAMHAGCPGQYIFRWQNVSKRFAIIAAKQEKRDCFVSGDLSGQEASKLGTRLSGIRRRLQKAYLADQQEA